MTCPTGRLCFSFESVPSAQARSTPLKERQRQAYRPKSAHEKSPRSSQQAGTCVGRRWSLAADHIKQRRLRVCAFCGGLCADGGLSHRVARAGGDISFVQHCAPFQKNAGVEKTGKTGFQSENLSYERSPRSNQQAGTCVYRRWSLAADHIMAAASRLCILCRIVRGWRIFAPSAVRLAATSALCNNCAPFQKMPWPKAKC
jgi:hypothetical protein